MSVSPPDPHRTVIVFDVNETLSDLSPMAERFADLGAPAMLAKLWFASVLRDGFALTAAGGQEVLRHRRRGPAPVLADVPLDRPPDAAVEHVMSGFTALPVHPDVADGVRALSAAGYRLVTLSNGSASVAQQLLERAGLRDQFEALLSVEDAGAWKPATSGLRVRREAVRCRHRRDGAGRGAPVGPRRRRSCRAVDGMDRPGRRRVPVLLRVPDLDRARPARAAGRPRRSDDGGRWSPPADRPGHSRQDGHIGAGHRGGPGADAGSAPDDVDRRRQRSTRGPP